MRPRSPVERPSTRRKVICVIVFLALLYCYWSYVTYDPHPHSIPLRLSISYRSRQEIAIPHRIHQTYIDEYIPTAYTSYIQSWLKHHPSWEYYFWSDKDAKKMIQDRYPQFVSLYDSYTHKLQRSDVIRYFILHAFGGVYCDMDMVALKNLEPFLRYNTSVLVPEPSVQSKLLYSKSVIVTNAILASIPNHPFLDYLINSLAAQRKVIRNSIDVLMTTGPNMLQRVLDDYNRQTNCLQAYFCRVYVSDPQYLVPTFDVNGMKAYRSKCKKKKRLTSAQIEACEELTRTNYANDVPPTAYSNHLWLHIGWKQKYEDRHSISIMHIVPNVRRYLQHQHTLDSR